MKRLLIFSLILALLLPCAFGCGGSTDDGKISIVCTLFPQYDWVRSIVGESDSISVTLLVKNGADGHSYQPTAADIMTISSCDMIVYLGADSDIWVQEALKRAKNDDTEKIELTELEGITLHNISSSSHDHGDHGDHEHEHGHVFDEHIWLSLKNASVAIDALSESICAIDESNAELYRANAERYKNELLALDGEYSSAVASVGDSNPFMLFADRFPFVYLLEDYEIEYAAAFEGCTTDVDAGFDTVLRLIKEADEHKISYIAVTETSDMALARTVAESAKGDIQIIVLNSLQGVTASQLEGDLSYLSAMRENLRVISLALGIKGE